MFKFTHGVSFARYLQLVKPSHLSAAEIEMLDYNITELCGHGVTEAGLNKLLKLIIDKAGAQKTIKSESLRDLLVDKLESGEYTPDKNGVCSKEKWDGAVKALVETGMTDFYNGDGGLRYTNRYQKNPVKTFVSRICDFVDWERDATGFVGRTALDVGCGPGQYAKLLMEEGFTVELVDTSKDMLEQARQHLGLPVLPPTRDIYNLRRDFKKESFDLIFACAMMVHVPLEKADGIYQSFYQLLKPGGLLFVNFKLGDHSLISADGRFFEYYQDHNTPMNALRKTGFYIEEAVLRLNRKNTYGDPKAIRWANFYCKKPTSI
jgi:SAM-dependent methyltransferase